VEAAPLSGAAGPARATVRRRPLVAPLLWTDHLEGSGYAPDHPYVRRYWTAVLGPGAVADLLRLMTAARRRLPLRQPLHLAELAQAGLVGFADGRVWVHNTVPPLSPEQVRRLPPALRDEHRLECWQPPNCLRSTASSSKAVSHSRIDRLDELVQHQRRGQVLTKAVPQENLHFNHSHSRTLGANMHSR
jgi:hypothetical protein